MNQLERIKEIDRLIRIKETGNAQKLADRFGTLRTFYIQRFEQHKRYIQYYN